LAKHAITREGEQHEELLRQSAEGLENGRNTHPAILPESAWPAKDACPWAALTHDPVESEPFAGSPCFHRWSDHFAK